MGKIAPDRVYAMQTEEAADSFDGIPIGQGGSYDAFTQSDAAALCAGLMRKCDLADRVRHGKDKTSAAELERILWIEVAGLAHKEKWPVCIGQTTLRSLSELAVAELLEPALYREEAAKVAWFGSHVKVEPDRVWKVWERTWRQRYAEVYNIVCRWADVADSHTSHGQREEP